MIEGYTYVAHLISRRILERDTCREQELAKWRNKPNRVILSFRKSRTSSTRSGTLAEQSHRPERGRLARPFRPQSGRDARAPMASRLGGTKPRVPRLGAPGNKAK